jgi:hypothetical protein
MAAFGDSCRDSGHGLVAATDPLRMARKDDAPQQRVIDARNRGNGQRSVRLDAGKLDHLGPFLGFSGYELPEIGGRPRKRRAA